MKNRKPSRGTERARGSTPGTRSVRRRTRPRKPALEAPPASHKSPAAEPRRPDFSIVGIGASAGGLEAFTQLLENLPPDTGMAFVLVQHHDPTHASLLPEILPRSTAMPVVEVRKGSRIEPNRVYVIPSGSRATAADGRFELVARAKGGGRELPIDIFFESLAKAYGSRAIGVILSGSLSDGALGLKAIKAGGGITFAQDESTAKFHAMPRAAIALDSVDLVLPPDGIARELARIGKQLSSGSPAPDRFRRPARAAASADNPVSDPEERELARIFQMLQKATNVDFSTYRPTTLRRRLARRMLVTRTATLKEYVQFLRKDPAEVHFLYDDILITVTGFFRDPESFEALKSVAFPSILKNRDSKNPVRIWVPGCSTGEEVYSIAISLFEHMSEAGLNPPVQIFATDVSEPAIEKARAGTYLENAVTGVSKERLKRLFVKTDGRYQVVKALRDVCIFARQNIAADPPFSNLDLLSCRNLLIYLEPDLQKRIVPLFHYALKPDGFLLLGSSETLGSYPELFYPVDRSHRIFAKRPGAERPAFQFPRQSAARPGAVASKAEPLPRLVDPQREADRLILNRYSPPGVVVNDRLEILQFRGRTSPYLESAPGTPSLNLLKMAREDLLVELRSAILKAKRSGQSVRSEGIRVRQNGTTRTVDLEVVPIKSDGDAMHYLVVFDEAREGRPGAAPPVLVPKKATSHPGLQKQAIARLEQELTATKDYLQAIIEEQEAANEELTSANEEILSSNEELQSTNEELETAKEELQSANEELTTVNEELGNRNAEIAQINSDLLNLLSTINTPIVMVGVQGQIRRFTPTAEKLLGILPTDRNRPIKDLRPTFDGPGIGELVARVVDTANPVEREIQTRDGRWYAMHVRPYRTLDNRIDGGVLLFHDIDPLKRTIEQANRSRDYAEALVETMRESLIVLDEDLKIRTANRAFYETLQMTPINLAGKRLFELGGDWGGPESPIRSVLEKVARNQESVRDYEFEVAFPHLGRKTFVASARSVRLPADGETLILLAVEDISATRSATEELRASEVRYRRLFETAREAIWLLDGATGEILDANPFTAELFGYSRDELIGHLPWELDLYGDAEEAKERFERTVRVGYGFAPDVAMRTRGGQMIRVEKISSVYAVGDRQVVQSNIRDLTERRRLEDELRQIQKMESIGRLAGGIAHDFNNILNIISAYGALLAKGGDAARRSQSAEAIEKAVQRGAALVRQLLTFARRDGTTFENVRLNALVRELASMVSETFPKSIRVVLDLDPDVPAIKADPNQLHQALLNLCVNARDAMPGGGELKLTTALAAGDRVRARFPDAREDRYVCVGVSDEGEGIDEETRTRIFEPFFTTKQAQDGSGLGLAVVYGVVNAHSGFIDVTSEKGKGASFSIYLPVGLLAEESPERAAFDTWSGEVGRRIETA